MRISTADICNIHQLFIENADWQMQAEPLQDADTQQMLMQRIKKALHEYAEPAQEAWALRVNEYDEEDIFWNGNAPTPLMQQLQDAADKYYKIINSASFKHMQQNNWNHLNKTDAAFMRNCDKQFKKLQSKAYDPVY